MSPIYKKSLPKETCKVRMKGLEPPRLTALDPKSSAATNYATSAKATLVFCSAKVAKKEKNPNFFSKREVFRPSIHIHQSGFTNLLFRGFFYIR